MISELCDLSRDLMLSIDILPVPTDEQCGFYHTDFNCSIIGGAAFMGNFQSAEPLSAEVLAHTPTIQRYASEYGIPEYVAVIQAIMMQESGGRGTDPMQSSECPYNTEYPNSPGAIQDADYSINVGIQYYADCIREHPNSRKYYLFDWDHDGVSDHVGIVESCDGTTVYTVEGNSGDAVKENSYTVHSASIMGYGIVSGM